MQPEASEAGDSASQAVTTLSLERPQYLVSWCHETKLGELAVDPLIYVDGGYSALAPR